MGNAIFKRTPTLDRIVAHAKERREKVLLVHDQGLYLMTSSLRAEGSDSALCAFAVGCDPSKDEDWYDEARAICGGDDFGEEVNAAEIDALLSDGGDLEVAFSPTHFTMRAVYHADS